MLHPSYQDLMRAVNSDVEEGEQPVVNSRYSIVIATSKRARQLINKSKQEETDPTKVARKPLSIAIEELQDGKVKIMGDCDEE